MINLPEARWAGPEDSKWDRYYAGFERWVNDHYDMPTQTIFGMQMTWEQATESDELIDDYIERLHRV